jgi:riboflavin kinase
MEQFESKLGWRPFEGTFNLRLNEDEVPKIEAMKAAEGILIEGFEQEDRTFGKAWLFKCVLINGTKQVGKCAVISPKRTHYKRVIEVISPAYLRDKFGAKDGDSFIVRINLGDV